MLVRASWRRLHLAIENRMAASMPGKYAILVAGHVSPFCKNAYGDYGRLYTDLLRDEPNETFDVYHVIDQHFPKDDKLDEYRGFVVGGSRHDAHSQIDWIVRLRELIARIHARQRSNLLGICFGHQAIAIALGGASGPSVDAGWQAGIQTVNLTPQSKERFPHLPAQMPILQLHRDQVSRLPPGATLLASSSSTPIEAFLIGNRVMGIQGHPELNCKIVTDIVETRSKDGVIPNDQAQAALNSMKSGDPDISQLQPFLKNFLKQA